MLAGAIRMLIIILKRLSETKQNGHRKGRIIWTLPTNREEKGHLGSENQNIPGIDIQ